MKKILIALILSIITINADARNYRQYNRYLEYWERTAYREGFLDGYDGLVPRCYQYEMDRIAYDIGYIDGEDAYYSSRYTSKCSRH
jgi:hypothetical protein